ncbi:hypothetical protein CANINC_003649 [Pichia inconspicua]|uniref:Ras-GAP domain-containing protein n=1 Tax=Pichia inconspicua TaxID=52247 RepID=A0A4T0WY48_9ASCO|nr:hypothetical protein CANINC_003649 [[Candida] inconspicua]
MSDHPINQASQSSTTRHSTYSKNDSSTTSSNLSSINSSLTDTSPHHRPKSSHDEHFKSHLNHRIDKKDNRDFYKYTDSTIGKLSVDELHFIDVKHDVIPLIFSRIEALLPYRSGFTIEQMFADPFYIQSKTYLFKLSQTFKFSDDLIASSYNCLVRILKSDPVPSLDDKSHNTLSSIYVIVFLLNNFIDHLKSNERLTLPTAQVLQKSGLMATSNLTHNLSLTSAPKLVLENELSAKLLRLLTSLKTDTICLSTLSNITDPSTLESSFFLRSVRNQHSVSASSLDLHLKPTSPTSASGTPVTTPISGGSSMQFLSSSSSSSSVSSVTAHSNTISFQSDYQSGAESDHKEVIRLTEIKMNSKSYEIINMIDENVSGILAYIAAINQQHYLNVEKRIFKHVNIDALYIKGSHIIQFAFLSSNNFNANILLIRDIFNITKRNSQKFLLLHFFAESIPNWALYRTKDFLKSLEHPMTCKNAEVLFDLLYKHLDMAYSPKVYYSVLSYLLLFQQKQILKFINDKSQKSTTQVLKRSITNVTKLSSNKQKFLQDFIHLINKAPESAQPLCNFLLVGCCVGLIDKSHILYQFVLFLKGPLLKDLKIESFDQAANLRQGNHYSTISNTPNYISKTLALGSSTGSSSSSIQSSTSNTSSNSSSSSRQLANSEVIHELKIYIFAISSVIETSEIPSRIVKLLKFDKQAFSIIPLYIGAFRLLVLIPTLSPILIPIVQDLSPYLLKIFKILSHHIIKTMQTGNPFPEIGSPHAKNKNDKHSFFKGSPLKLLQDETNLTDSESDLDTPDIPLFKLTTPQYPLQETLHTSNILKQIANCDTNTLKDNMINLLMLYSTFPFFTFNEVTHRGIDNPDFLGFEKNFRKFIHVIIPLLTVDDPDIVSATVSFIMSFPLTVANVEPIKVFVGYIAVSVVVDEVSAVAISSETSTKKRNKLIKIIQNLFEKREEHLDLNLIFSNAKIVEEFHGIHGCHRVIRNFECVVFMGLFSNDVKTIRICKRLLATYVSILKSKHHRENCFDRSNIPLAEAILDDKMTFGIASIRKKIKDHLCHITEPNELLLTIWPLMYDRVHVAYNYSDDDSAKLPANNESKQSIEDIEIYSEYLMSFGGIILSDKLKDDPRRPELVQKLETFVKKTFESLFDEDSKKREHTKEILSVSVHPYLAKLIIDQIKLILPTFQRYLKSNELNICELVLSVLRFTCQLDSHILLPYAIDLWNINFSMLKMFNFENNTPEFLRLKLKFCKFQVIFLSKLENLALNGNILLKNQYARIAADYLENTFEIAKNQFSNSKVLNFGSTTKKPNPVMKLTNKVQEFKESELKDLQMDIRVETLIMLKYMFYKLPLDTPRQDYSSDDNRSAAAVVFSNYFNLFVRLLETLNESKNDKDATYTNVAHRSSNMIQEAIQALINLLNSNSKIGLKYSLPLGLHHDELIRVSFIDVFSNIIKDIYTNYERRESISSFYEEGCYIFQTDLDLFMACANSCPRSEIEAYATTISQLKINEKEKLHLYLSLIKHDIVHTADKNEILRSNTVGTRVVALYSYDNATKYLVTVFRPIMEELLEKQELFEIEKVQHFTEDEKKLNLCLFLKYMNLIADRLIESIDYMPLSIRLIAKTIYDTTEATMPENKLVAINAYLFLRIINPTIVSPGHLNIVDDSNTKFKRCLIQLARVIQTIVNDAPVRIPLLESHPEQLILIKKKLFRFMVGVVDFNFQEKWDSIDSNEPLIDAAALRTQFEHDQKFAKYLHSYFYNNWHIIREAYLKANYDKKITLETKLNTIKRFSTILENLGLPQRLKGFEIPESVRNDKSPRGILLYDFMSKTTLAIENVSFIKVLITKDGLPLICITMHEFPVDLTPEMYAFNLLQTMCKFWEGPYCFLLDLTAFSNFDVFIQGRDMLHSIIPSVYKANCKRVYYVNMPVDFFSIMKRLDLNYNDEEKEVKPEFVFVSTSDDAKIMNKNKLIGYTTAISHDGRVTFHDVSIYQSESNRFIPVKLKIGNQFIQIYSGMPQRLKIRDKMHLINLVDCYKISDLGDIEATSYTGVANEISMVNNVTNKRIIITSTKKIEIMRTLYFSRAKLNKNIYQENDDLNETNPHFIVGQLLNLSFSGLLSTSDEIRKASYSLLASIKNYVGLKINKTIESFDDVVFPYGDIDYICEVSSNLAENHPNLTYSFLHGCFLTFDRLSDEDKNSMVLCISPWIKNIHTHVYMSDSTFGPIRTSDLIRKCVKASRNQNVFQVFSLFVWPQLSLEDGLIEIIIDEIVAASIDHEAEGNKWFEVTKYWPMRSSIEICSVIIRRMKEKSYSMTLGESEVEVHTRWIETIVLTRFLSFLIFDSLLFVERYISEIFFIVTIYMDYGPLELRRSLLTLLTRTFHSYLSKPSLNEQQREYIKKQMEIINGARFRMIFGLTRDNADYLLTNLESNDIFSKANAVTTLCDLLTDFLSIDLETEEYALQMIKWNSCVARIAFNNSSQLQSRAILILGSLTQQGISNKLTLKFMDLMGYKYNVYISEEYLAHNPDPAKLNNLLCSFHAFGKTICGISGDSIFHPLMFWCHINLALDDDVSFFRYAIDFIAVTLKKLYEHCTANNLRLVDYLLTIQDPSYKKMEKSFNFELTRENFDAILVLICFKGLENTFTYSITVEAASALLKLRYQEHLKYPDDNTIDYRAYLFFIYLSSTSNEEMIETYNRCGIPNLEYSVGTLNFKVPNIILEWFSSSSKSAFAVCFGATNFFLRQKVDELAISRVISMYIEMSRYNPKVVVKLFSQMDGILQKLVTSSSTPILLENTLNMITKLMTDSNFERYHAVKEDYYKKMEEAKLSGFSMFTFDKQFLYGTSDDDAILKIRKERAEIIKEVYVNAINAYKRTIT